jgi:hypothetical protein
LTGLDPCDKCADVMDRASSSQRIRRGALSALGLAMSLSLTVSALASSTVHSTLDAPSNVVASAGVGVLSISWNYPDVSTTTFTVTSSPPGKKCVVVATTSCSIEVTDTTPWRFSVRAQRGSARSAASSLSDVVTTHPVIVLAGQSNAEGARSYDVDPLSHVNYFAAPYVTAADSADRLTWLAWPKPQMAPPPSSEPVALDTPQLLSGVAVFGTEIGLGRQLYADTNTAVTIIKATYPGTALAHQWRPSSHGALFDQMCAFVHSVMSSDAAHGRFDVLESFIWFQGESDALLHNGHYQKELGQLVTAIRHRMSIDASAPIVIAKESILQREQYDQSHHGCAKDNCARAIDGNKIIRRADVWAGNHLAHVIVVDSAGLDRTPSSNFLHLSNVGELQLGATIARRLESQLK